MLSVPKYLNSYLCYYLHDKVLFTQIKEPVVQVTTHLYTSYLGQFCAVVSFLEILGNKLCWQNVVPSDLHRRITFLSASV